ncbi:MAG: metallophosphoesterase family protein [Victivallales bacterium]|nr:metallophosphoesterase family protein [Victivallales bacterium]MCF7888777.1 metallophosphoesterase family protein [Victivallales bacterium]
MKEKIKFLSVSDIHGSVNLIDNSRKSLYEADVILISGDITHFGGKKEAAEVINEFSKYNKNIFAVSGNCDKPEVDEYLTEKNINLNKKITDIYGIKVFGLNASLKTPSSTPNEYTSDYYKTIIKYYDSIYPDSQPVIILTHQPPFGTVCDLIGDFHAGCQELTDFIKKHQPLACLCGHIHEADGIDQIGKTYVMNPGRFDRGGAVLADFDLTTRNAEFSFVELF